MKRILPTLACFLLTLAAFAQHPHPHPHGRAIEFPDVPGYRTLKCDLHIHSVFSDGSVWPTLRVEEALRDSLDVISLTEHLEYQPYRADIPHPDRNRAFQLAKDFAAAFDLLVVNGSEITRKAPLGHFNAIFLQDANPLVTTDSIAAFREAKRQGAFVFWNHPSWPSAAADGVARVSEVHRRLIDEGLVQGIEVANDLSYYDEALQIALDNNLTILATSDIHSLIDWRYEVPEGGHRPITLVFATDRTEAAFKEALLAGRTVAWFDNTLIGRPEHLGPLLKSCLRVAEAFYAEDFQGSKILTVKIENRSDADFQVQNLGPFTFNAHSDFITLPAHETTALQVKTLERKTDVELSFRVLNAVTAPGEHPALVLPVRTGAP